MALLAVGLVAAVVFYVLKARKRSVYWSFSFFMFRVLKVNYVQGL